MKKSTILREAKKILAKDIYQLDKGYRRYICHAIEFVCQSSKELIRHDADELRNFVASLIMPYASAATWLLTFANVPLEDLTDENMQTYRHRWIDYLILHFEARGE